MANNAEWNITNTYSELPSKFYTEMELNPVYSPKLQIVNESLAASLGLSIEKLRSPEGVEILAGNETIEGGIPLAQAYAGHQFGNFTMLGDGRAILLGEQIAPNGKRMDIQLKGAGRTPYSRGGDGRAALGPMLREYIISEAMAGLKIPTTRSLAVVTTGENIVRETELPGAIMTRIADSHLRVGTFQFAANWGDTEELQALADYAIERHYPTLKGDEKKYLKLLEEVMKRQAQLLAKWQLVGFIHGVMNTDNMTISGETIDYGPCAFMNTFDPSTVFSSIDVQGRYAYGNQPRMAGWNIARFAESLLTLLSDSQEEAVQLAQNTIEQFPKLFKEHWLAGMRAKLGLFNEKESDEELINELLMLMHQNDADYTNTFRALTLNDKNETNLFRYQAFIDWFDRWQSRLDEQEETRTDALKLMQQQNPAVIPRNHRVEEALEAAVRQEDYSVMHKLLEMLADPYDYTKDYGEYTLPPVETAIPYQTYCGT